MKKELCLSIIKNKKSIYKKSYKYVILLNVGRCLKMYFDPGTGSLIIQLVLAGLASVGAFFVIFKNKVKNIFKKKDSDKDEKK